MLDIFLVKLLLTFIVASIFITANTILAEKVSPKIVGFIGGIPNTVLISLLFIGITQSPLISSQSTTVIPIIMGIDALFIVIYVYLSKYSFLVGFLSALLVWFVLVSILVFIKFNNFSLSLAALLILMVLSYFLVEHVIKTKTIYNKKYKFSLANIIFRGVFSGTIVTLVVIFAKIGGPLFGGIGASFPAAMISTMIITNRAQGIEFSRSVMKILMISGPVNVAVYATAVRFLYPEYGLLLGTIYSLLIALISTYLTYKFVVKRVA